jgi:outer membrane murein-binding lipoprotein Lpp
MRTLPAPLIAIISAALLLLAGCGGQSASDRVCDARSELGSAVEGVVDELGAGNLGDARDQVPDVQDAYDELNAAVDELSAEQADELRPQVEAIRSDLQGLDDAADVDDLRQRIDAVGDDISSLTSQVADQLSCD